MTNNTRLFSKFQGLAILFLLFTFNASLQAAIPDNVDYQGYLTDSVDIV